MVSEIEVRSVLRTLAAVYKPPDGDRAEVVHAWLTVLRGVDADMLGQAVRTYMRSDRQFFPKPGQILALVRQLESESFGDRPPEGSTDWNQLQDGPCPVCGAVLEAVVDPLAHDVVWDTRARAMRRRTRDDAPPGERFGMIHDRAAHARAGVPIVGLHN